MFDLSDNYYLRKHYFKNEEVPTQSMIKQKMTPPLAKVYFDSMGPKLKVLAGLEPLLKGGGYDWYVPPKDLLEGRTVLKPVTKEVLDNLSHLGIDNLGMILFEKHRKARKSQIERAFADSDLRWRNDVQSVGNQKWLADSVTATEKNTEFIHNAFNYFTYLYRKSFDKFETLFHEAAIAEIKRIKEKAHEQMQIHYSKAMKAQATMLYDKYSKKLMKEKERLRAEFIKNIEECRIEMCDKIHDLRVDKHIAVEKIRQFLECQKLACQIYVALKEREECIKEMDEAEYSHKKISKKLAEDIAFKDFEISLEIQKKEKRDEFNIIWKKKVCHVVKKFQQFVSYCLNILPNHVEFFLNIEKLMLLQLNVALEEPAAKSIIEVEKEIFHTPIPRPHPFYLFCDRGYKPKLNQDLCPKHCTSSSSQLPVIVINKRYMYAACDNFEEFNTKMKHYIHGKRGDDADFVDDAEYENYVPVKYTSSQQLLDLKLESSLLQIMQQEIGNLRELPIDCGVCKVPYCFCAPTITPNPIQSTLATTATQNKKLVPGMKVTRRTELMHEREPKWESFLEYVRPKKCSCVKTIKKDLGEHLPVYMRHTSSYEAPELPNYETCTVTTLKNLVKQARAIPPPSYVAAVQTTTRDVGTQYIDIGFEALCTCFSEAEIPHLLSDLTIDSAILEQSTSAKEFKVVGTSMSNTFLKQEASSFATDRAYSLRNLVEGSPNVQDIFMREFCNFK